MEQKNSPKKTDARAQAAAKRRLRRRLRLVRNWIIFLSVCALIVFAMSRAVLWVLPKVHALLTPQEAFIAAEYDDSSYVFDASDPYLALVNNNLPLAAEPSPALAPADEAAGVQLEAKAAEAYRAMAAAALEDGIELRLTAGYMDSAARQAAFGEIKQAYIQSGLSDTDAAARAQTVVPRPECSEYATGCAADILSADYDTKDTGFDSSRAFEWLCAYAAEYGFILRWPEDRQAATGMAYEPWHWRYVGAENALAIRASGLSLEEFLALRQAN